MESAAHTEADSPTCIVADFKSALVLRHKLAEMEHPSDKAVAEGRLLVGVRPLDADRARKMIEANERFKRSGDGSELSEDDAVRTLLKQVHVRVLEWMTIKVKEPRAAVVIDVEAAAY